MEERMKDINPAVEVVKHKCFFLPENADQFPFESYDYVVDAVDTVTAKIEIIMRCKKLGIPVISCMGAGNKLDPSRFKVADIYKTTMCPLAKVMRHEMKKRGVKKLKVVYSDEKPTRPIEDMSISAGATVYVLQGQPISALRGVIYLALLPLLLLWQGWYLHQRL